ncbi:LIC10906 family membrane protein [Leptospira stimsonii]|uniref:Histidine kinase N-terminal 7TM region domain-containing protein n=1 Tax=Leptospira stimsonii TaxID=2202203 RepID=A0A396YRT8_9LEPT|nr:histidine kinase N-terminal 7TM domain-containing protein [Leptospira stimsonii]RHX84753.1 hypothetical protein DLM75_22330 [Leptospira stimsonii]
MGIVFGVSLFCSSSILLLGIYVFRVGERASFDTRTNFLTLAATLSVWVFGSGVREFIPESLSRVAPNWILIAAVFVPFYLKELSLSILENKYEPSYKFRILEYFLICYLVLSCLFSATIDVKEEGISVYKPRFAYHVLIFYSFVNISISIFFLLRKAILHRGIVRVRSTLLMLGTLFGFIISILFVYVLPFFGIFKGYLSVFGILIWVFLWSVAIIQYNAFESRSLYLKSRFVARRKLPLLSRFTYKPILILHSFVDPLDYRLQLRNSRAEVVKYIMDFHLSYQKNTNMKPSVRIRKITRIVERFLK